MPDMHIHLHDPSPEAVAVAVDGAHRIAVADPPPLPTIEGLKVVERDGGAVLQVSADARRLLLDFGWAPPVDGA